MSLGRNDHVAMREFVVENRFQGPARRRDSRLEERLASPLVLPQDHGWIYTGRTTGRRNTSQKGTANQNADTAQQRSRIEGRNAKQQGAETADQPEATEDAHSRAGAQRETDQAQDVEIDVFPSRAECLLPSIEAVDLRLLTYIESQCITLLRMDMSKDLVAASATPLVLAILAEGDSYGYAIIKRVAELSGGHLQWTDGMLYPVLHRLERQGHVAAKWSASENGRRRKYYRITRQGLAQLAAQRQQWQAVDGTLRGIWMEACTA